MANRRYEQAIIALLDPKNKTLAEAAADVGINEKTLRAWMKRPAFRDQYRGVRGEVLERMVAQLLAVCTEAVETLRRNLTCGKPAPENRAAVAIVEQAVKGAETLDLAEQLQQVKRELEALKKHGNRHVAPGSGKTPGGDGGPDGGGQSAARRDPAGPGPDHDGGGLEPRPLADDPDAQLF